VSEQAELFLDDVLREPETLEHVLDLYEGGDSPLNALELEGLSRVRLIGMGSSRFAALSVASMLRALGVDAAAERSSMFAGTPAGPKVLAVCISANGETPETIEHAERHRGVSRVVAITNKPESRLAGVADVVLPVEAGVERGGVACRTYQATLAVLIRLAGRLGAQLPDLRPAVAAGRAIRDGREAWLDQTVEVLGGAVAVVAPDERISSAEQGALAFREGPRIPATACEAGDWAHVDVYLTRRPGYRALLFAGSRFDAKFAEWMQRRGAAFVAVGGAVEGAALTIEHGAGHPLCALLVETSVAELLAGELWRRSLRDG
jgi:glutamine---fructose-6-phosphate transaminase (isomerizing)